METTPIAALRGDRLWYQCPVCDDVHGLPVRGTEQPQWGWNGSLTAPTLTPSVRSFSGPSEQAVTHCHVFITDGKVQILSDSKRMGGETVPLPSVPAWLLRED